LPPVAAEAAFTPKFAAAAPMPAVSGQKLPTWLLSMIFALVFVGVVYGVYRLVGRSPAQPATAVENPAAKPGAAANPIQRYIEISAVRFLEDP
jgi:hypothetical protein